MTIKIENLTFPTGEFSHTELAEFNGLDRKKVWTAYQKAIADGIIKSSGNERKSGKGKAAALWVVADPTKVKMSPDSVPVSVVVVPAAEDLVAAKPGRKPKVKTEVVAEVVPTDVVQPATAPVQETVPVVIINDNVPLPPAKPEDLKVCITPAGIGEITTLAETCPFCKTPLLSATTTNGGVRVWCGVNDIRICSCSENPYGYSNNVKNAIEILTEKYWNNRPEAKA